VRVSAHSGEGLDELKAALGLAITALGERTLGKSWFLPIDRVFTVEGHGTIVTGTLASGRVSDFSEAELMPGAHRARIRSVESHGEKSGVSEAGMRTALNVSGVRKEAIHRGQAIGSPGSLFETSCLNVRLASVEEVKHAQRVRVHVGTGEAIGRVFLFDKAPGFAQIRLEEPTACARGQRLILRNYSPPTLLAGGEIVIPNAKPRRKNDAEVASLLEGGGEAETLAGRVRAELEKHSLGVSTERICEALGESPQSLGGTFEELKARDEALGFAGTWVASNHFSTVCSQVVQALLDLHGRKPQAAALAKAAVLSAAGLGWPGKSFDRLLAKMAEDGLVVVRGNEVAHIEHRISLNEKQSALLERVLAKMEEAGANAPSPPDLAAAVGAPVQAIEEMIRLGLETGTILRIDEGIYFPPSVLESLKTVVRGLGKSFTVAQFRDATQSSRKFALPILQHFDETRFTRRLGDERIVIG
jgi:selenocysteine-specific elongation factor